MDGRKQLSREVATIKSLEASERLEEKCSEILKGMGVWLRFPNKESPQVMLRRDEDGFYELSPKEGKIIPYFNYNHIEGKGLPRSTLSEVKGKYLEIDFNDNRIRLHYNPTSQDSDWEVIDFDKHFRYELHTGVKGTGEERWTGKTS